MAWDAIRENFTFSAKESISCEYTMVWRGMFKIE
jgi:hypothetical protein